MNDSLAVKWDSFALDHHPCAGHGMIHDPQPCSLRRSYYRRSVSSSSGACVTRRSFVLSFALLSHYPPLSLPPGPPQGHGAAGPLCAPRTRHHDGRDRGSLQRFRIQSRVRTANGIRLHIAFVQPCLNEHIFYHSVRESMHIHSL